MTMPAGIYYVGDLCYVMNNEWNEVCKITFTDEDILSGEFALSDGRKFAIYSTAYGDGCYMDQYGKEYSVDSGSIGCIKIADITEDDIREGQIVEFSDPFQTSCVEGLIRIGDIRIDTTENDECIHQDEDEYEN